MIDLGFCCFYKTEIKKFNLTQPLFYFPVLSFDEI